MKPLTIMYFVKLHMLLIKAAVPLLQCLFPALTQYCNLQCHLELFMDKRLYSGKHLMEIRYLNI